MPTVALVREAIADARYRDATVEVYSIDVVGDGAEVWLSGILVPPLDRP